MTNPIHASQTQWESTASAKAKSSGGVSWGGKILSGLSVLFFALDGVMKLFQPAAVVEGTVRLGYPQTCIVALGIVLLISTMLYAVPRTAILGAILLTGYLGGAVATHVRVSDNWFNMLFPVFFGALVWGGLWFRDRRVRNLLPLARD